MNIFIRLLQIFLAILVFCIFLILGHSYKPELSLKGYQKIEDLIKRKGRETDRYRQTQDFLLANGAQAHIGKWLNPYFYWAINIVTGLCLFLLVSYFNFYFGIIAFFVGSRCFYFYIIYANSKDNVKMLPEIKLIYNALEIQIRAGVYLTDALSECFTSIREERLREALLEMSGDIVVNKDATLALQNFQKKFNNRYIDGLCITLLQALESGQAVELLGDISDQIKDMERALLERKKSSLDRKFTFYQLGMLVALMIVVLYACITKMYSSILKF